MILSLLLDNAILLIFLIPILKVLFDIYNKLFVSKNTLTDINLINRYMYLEGKRKKSKLPMSAYGEWSKYTIM